MEYDLAWMNGRTFAEVVAYEGVSWVFRVNDGTELRSESSWRIVSAGHIVLSSEDHGQWYGLPQPIDAEAECRRRIVESSIRSVEVRDATRDLVVTFESGDRLEIIPMSSGYESWLIAKPDGTLIAAQGGGNLVSWRPDA